MAYDGVPPVEAGSAHAPQAIADYDADGILALESVDREQVLADLWSSARRASGLNPSPVLFCLRRQRTSNSIVTTAVLLTQGLVDEHFVFRPAGLFSPYANPSWSLRPQVLLKTVFDEVRLTLVAPEWPRAPWFSSFLRVAERQFRVDCHVYLTEVGKLRPAPRWATGIAVVDCAHY